MAKRRTYSAALKARVVQEAMRGDRTVQQVAAKHGVHSRQAGQWKREANERLVDLFERGEGVEQDENEAEIRSLRRKVGQLEVERDFLQSVWERVTEPPERESEPPRPDNARRSASD